MAPARKDSPQANDPSRPSTSRAFSPTIAPPAVKRARTSTGVPPRRQSTGTGGRQARMEEFIDEKDLQEGLLLALTETADELLKEDEEEGKEKVEIESEVISAAARIVWDAMAEDWATDLVAFSRHAGRETIREDDVKLLMRRNPDMLAEIMSESTGEEDGEGSSTMGAIRRRSTGGLVVPRSRMGARDGEETEISDGITTPMAGSSMESIVPETPQGVVPLAHSTPMSGRSKSIMKKKRGAEPAFSLPSPIREDEEEDAERGEGRRVNRSIMDQLSDTTGRAGGPSHIDYDDFTPLIIDLRHPREQEDEARRMRERQDQGERPPGPSTSRQDYGKARSPELFEHSANGKEKDADHDSFDDDIFVDDKADEGEMRGGETSHRMSESAALREMLGEEKEEKEKTVVEDSFDDDSIQFVEEKKATQPSYLPIGDFSSTSAATATVIQSGGAVASAVAAPAAPPASTASSEDSFYKDDILDDPPPAANVPAAVPADDNSFDVFLDGSPPTANVPAAAAASTVQQPSVPAAVQSIRADDHDSFDDDDDDFAAETIRSKENTPRSIGGPSTSRGVFAGDIFGLNDPPSSSKRTRTDKPSPTVPIRPSQMTTVPPKPSPTVLQKKTPQSGGKQTAASKNGKAVNGTFASFSFFGEDSSTKTTPTVQREDSDFLDTSTRQTTSATITPRGRGRGGGGRGRGTRGFPRKVDPNSKVNRMIREQSTPVRLSQRPPSRISEVVGTFEDDDFDISAFDD